MPFSAVQTLEDEESWERAKEIAANEYTDATGSNYWRIAIGIYKKMTRYVPTSVRGHRHPTWRLTR
jgi:hypothetical protein